MIMRRQQPAGVRAPLNDAGGGGAAANWPPVPSMIGLLNDAVETLNDAGGAAARRRRP